MKEAEFESVEIQEYWGPAKIPWRPNDPNRVIPSWVKVGRILRLKDNQKVIRKISEIKGSRVFLKSINPNQRATFVVSKNNIEVLYEPPPFQEAMARVEE